MHFTARGLANPEAIFSNSLNPNIHNTMMKTGLRLLSEIKRQPCSIFTHYTLPLLWHKQNPTEGNLLLKWSSEWVPFVHRSFWEKWQTPQSGWLEQNLCLNVSLALWSLPHWRSYNALCYLPLITELRDHFSCIMSHLYSHTLLWGMALVCFLNIPVGNKTG